MVNWLKGVVVENRQWTDRLFSLRIEAPLGEFRAGQFVRVALVIEGEQVARPYSLVSAPHEDLLEIYFDISEARHLCFLLHHARASEKGLNPSQEFSGAEGFAYIVVCTQL